MHWRQTRPSGSINRPGKVLILFALLLPVLLGMLGLVLDLGIILTQYRQAHNAADVVAMATALAKLRGASDSSAENLAQTLFAQLDGMGDATLTICLPPTAGSYAGKSGYVEAIVSKPVSTWFIQVLGGSKKEPVSARAMAGIEYHPVLELVMALDSATVPGLNLQGVEVNIQSPVAVNAEGSGWDENNQPVAMANPCESIRIGSTGKLRAYRVDAVGGVDFPSNILNLKGGSDNPLRAGQMTTSDPFLYLPVPIKNNGVVETYPKYNGEKGVEPQNVSLNLSEGGDYTFYPGIYASIALTGDGPATVRFLPGIYILKGGQPITLNIQSNAVISGEGVLFYNTGSDFDSATGLPDASDGAVLRSTPPQVTFGKMAIAAPNLTFTGLKDSNSPFNGLLLYQRRHNTQPISLQAQNLEGTIYAKWASTNLSGAHTYKSQFITGSLSFPEGPITLSPGAFANAPRVYLVE